MIAFCMRRLLVIWLLFLSSSCGRKQRNIFTFPQEEPKKLSIFDFPVVKGIRVTKVSHGNKITWFPLSNITQTKVFLGYNVYRLTLQGFIPKKPLNAIPLINNEFLDKQKTDKQSYLIKAVFRVNEKTIEGLSSQIKSN